MSELSNYSLSYYQNTTLSHRKELGQYFTKKSLRQEITERLPALEQPRIWEPSAGTGEFVKDLLDLYPDALVDATEIDPNLCHILKERFGNNPNVSVQNTDTLRSEFPKDHYDLVVGNPPYFEMYDLEETLQDRFSDVISGRANIYSLFLKVGLDALKEGGYLAFVIPPSMNNGAYFRKLRQYIVDQAGIYFLKVYSSDAFQDAQQSVMVLILQKGIKRNSYIFQKDDLLIFSEDAHHLQQAFKGKETLSDYGFKVKTGQVVWNQHKERLASERGDDTSFLVWAHNIDDSGAIVAKDKKPQFFRHGNKFAVQKGPAILVNRITGKVNGGTLRAAVVDEDFEFLAENHVNVITHNKCKDIKYYNDICDQLRSRETSDLIKCLTGNTQISKTELEKLIPLKSL